MSWAIFGWFVVVCLAGSMVYPAFTILVLARTPDDFTTEEVRDTRQFVLFTILWQIPKVVGIGVLLFFLL